ncbi:S1C family serine protease [Microlunatus soli]|uniref:Putative serine protease PepD n=1 Tax=Microlunatus soli TaxID=630515 RepID=A0A1H1T0J3_9ACTN|nr:trypsin-like peptidase domain-containing protein [Microlunatus soli]SDS53775.1 putative serine protease PepD [Microlunatus soli]
MNENGPGNGNDPQGQAGQQHFFGQGDGFGRPPQPSPYGTGYGQGGYGYTEPTAAYEQQPGQQPDDPERTTIFDRPAGGFPPPGGQGAGTGQGSAMAGPPAPPAGSSPSAQPAPQPSPRRRGRAGLMVLSLALAALVGGGVGVGSYAALGRDGQQVASPINVSTQRAPQQAKTDGTVEDAAKVIEPSVVTITVQSGTSGDIGSGVVLDKNGHILTNNHVVAGSQSGGGFPGSQGQVSGQTKITVTFSNGKTAQAKVVGSDETDDLAVIKVDGVKDLKPAKFAKSSSLSVGQSVVAVGAPLGLSQSVTSGIVSNEARPVRSGNNNDAVYMAVQTDAAINPGNSGGPLVDLDGSVVGIDSSIASTDEGGAGGGSESGNIGIGFAIPADVAVRVASELIDNGKSEDAVLGVTIAGTDDSSLGSTTTGVQLRSVESGSAADDAGLRAGDVVTALNGFKVTTADGLIAATHYYAPGTAVQVDYQRDGQSKTAKVTLGSA